MNHNIRIMGLFLCFILLFTYVLSAFVFAQDDIVIDTSYASDGYFTINYSGQAILKMKVGVSHNNLTTYYDYTACETSSYAFTEGDGHYTIALYSNLSGTKYKCIASKEVKVILNDDLSPFLVSTREVNFSKDDIVSQKADEICESLTDTSSKITAIYNYVHDNISYDYEFAANVSSGKIKTYTPKATEILSSHKGICYDFATLFAAMCRSQNIPCRIKKGYYQSIYHAWDEVYIDDSWYKIDTTTSINKDIFKKNKKNFN